MAPDSEQSDSLRSAVAERLRDFWGGQVTLATPESGDSAVSGRGHVLRFSVIRAPAGAPASVVVKRPRGDFTPQGQDPGTVMFFNEWASLQLLTELCDASDADLTAPRLHCGSSQKGFMVMEDLGGSARLDHALLGNDPVEATRTLVGLFTAIGRTHAVSFGRRSRFDAILASLGRGTERAVDPELPRRRRSAFEDALERLAVAPAAGFVDQMVALREAEDRQGEFDALVHGDPCPDNCHWTGDGVRLLDFEHGRFGDPFTDACYPRVPFPTCWCVGRLPPEAVARAVDAYRRELVQVAPAAAEPARFERGMLQASIRWVWGTFVHWHMPDVLDKDGDWGLATIRQRLLLRFRLLLERLEESQLFPAITETTRRTLAAFTTRWPQVPELPTYPAFR